MARVAHVNEGDHLQNPSQKKIEWKSNDKNFSYYDASLAEKLTNEAKHTPEEVREQSNIAIDLPFKFLFLQHYCSVGGFSEPSNSRVYSNEVFYIGSEELTVKCKTGQIAKGLYKEIKNDILAAGGKFNRVIYAMTPDGELVKIVLKGTPTARWGDFFDKNKRLIDNQWVVVNKAESAKKGAVKYSMPIFELGAALNKEENAKADVVAQELSEFMAKYFKSDAKAKETADSDEPKDALPAGVSEEEDDLPF